MRVLKSLLLAAVAITGCSDASIRTQNVANDTSMRSIDSSKQINNTSRLPQDSTTITVMQ